MKFKKTIVYLAFLSIFFSCSSDDKGTAPVANLIPVSYTVSTLETGLAYPTGIEVDNFGNLYVLESNNQVVTKIDTNGNNTTLAGGLPFGGTNVGCQDGIGSNSSFQFINDLVIDSNKENLFIAQSGACRKVRKLEISSGTVSGFSGSGNYGDVNGTASTAEFTDIRGLGIDSDGNIFIADEDNHKIKKITPSGSATTFAGSGTSGDADSTGITAEFNLPTDTAIDSNGNVYVTEVNNNRIRKITPSGVVTTIATSNDGIDSPNYLAIDNNDNVYFTEWNGRTIKRISATDGTITVIAGDGTSNTTDGIGTDASFELPKGICIDNNGVIYVTDNSMIRKLTPNYQ